MNLDVIENALLISMPKSLARADEMGLKRPQWAADWQVVAGHHPDFTCPLGMLPLVTFPGDLCGKCIGLWWQDHQSDPELVVHGGFFNFGIMRPIHLVDSIDEFVKKQGSLYSTLTKLSFLNDMSWATKLQFRDLVPNPDADNLEVEFLKTPFFFRNKPRYEDFLSTHDLILKKLTQINPDSLIPKAFVDGDGIRDHASWLRLLRSLEKDPRHHRCLFTTAETCLVAYWFKTAKKRSCVNYKLCIDFLRDELSPIFRLDNWQSRFLGLKRRQFEWLLQNRIEVARKEDPVELEQLRATGHPC